MQKSTNTSYKEAADKFADLYFVAIRGVGQGDTPSPFIWVAFFDILDKKKWLFYTCKSRPGCAHKAISFQSPAPHFFDILLVALTQLVNRQEMFFKI